MKYLKQAGESLPIVDRKSKFIASAAPVNSVTEAKGFIDQTCQRYRKATHNAYAYRIFSPEGYEIRTEDDGEVKGCAGKSILYVLEKMEITNVVVVVSRYYGGKKLGKGGLTRNYTKATTSIIKAIGTIEKES